MWLRSLLVTIKSSSSHLRGSLRTRAPCDAHPSFREASISSLIPFRSKKVLEESSHGRVGTVKQTASDGKLKSAQKKLKKFEKQNEKFIPVTRRTLVNKLVEEDGLLNWEEKRLLQSFAASLDAYYSQKFYALLEEAKVWTILCRWGWKIQHIMHDVFGGGQ